MIILVKLLIAHVLIDFFLPPNRLHLQIGIQEKGYKSLHLIFHVFLHLFLSFVLVLDLKYWVGIFVIAITHVVIDLWKPLWKNRDREVFFAAQLMHISVLIIVSDLYSPFIGDFFESVNRNDLLLLILAILLTTKVASHIIHLIISKWEPENEDKKGDSLSNAGSFIGILERVFVLGFIITGNIQLIGFLLAAKSVFRFGDLKESVDRKLTEYILIGTLLSFGIAIIIGMLYVRLSKML